MSTALNTEKNNQVEIDQMLVDITNLDNLLNLTGEIIITATNLDIIRKNIQDSFVNNSKISKDCLEMMKVASLTSRRISQDLHNLVMDVRLVKIKEAFQRFRRPVRALTKSMGKDIQFNIEGEETPIDKTIIEKICNPLDHLIRNAIDHGLEDPLERKKAGKPIQGTLTLKAYPKEKITIIEVTDDGRGIDPQKIISKALEKGFITRGESGEISLAEIYDLLFKPGFTTAGNITGISGRGVGLDVVKTAIEELGGNITLESKPGEGTTFRLNIPQLTAVNITDALTVKCNDSYFAIPIDSVIATLEVQKSDIATICKNEVIQYYGKVINVFHLMELLEGRKLDNIDKDDIWRIVIISTKKGTIGLKVDELLNPQKFVLFPWDELFQAKGISGSTIIGGNKLGLILNPADLIEFTLSEREEIFSAEKIDPETEKSTPDTEITPQQEQSADDTDAIDAKPEKSTAPDTDILNKNKEFFFEIKSLLADVNDQIFKLEKDPQNDELLHSVFRYLHSIKGDIIMMGFDSYAGFVHDVETILDRVRDKELIISEKIIDIMLDTVEELNKFVEAIGKNQIPDTIEDDLKQRIEEFKLAPQIEHDIEVSESAFNFKPWEEFLLQCKIRNGFNIYQIYINFEPAGQENIVVSYLILRKLSAIGDLVATIPDIAELERGISSNNMKIMLASMNSQTDIDSFIKKVLVKHYGVKEFEILQNE